MTSKASEDAMVYVDYRLRIKQDSVLRTPMQSDTVMGSLVWALAFTEGSQAARDLVQEFIEGPPPFVISDAFPGDMLPRPLVPSPSQPSGSMRDYATGKAIRKAQYVTADAFRDFQQTGLLRLIESIENPWIVEERLHAALSRRTDTTDAEGGNLYAVAGRFLKAQFQHLTIYVRVKPDHVSQVQGLFSTLFQIGFGKDKSSGAGRFRVLDFTPSQIPSTVEGASGFVSLSTYMPAATDPTQGWWALRVKYGKLGEGLGGANPFKPPMLQLMPGSVFITRGHPEPIYGRVVRGLSRAAPEAVQFCQCLAVPCRLPAPVQNEPEE